MCRFCEKLSLLEQPLFGKSRLLSKGSGNTKPICCLVHNAYDEEDNATKFKSDCEHVVKTREHKLLNIHRLTLEAWNFEQDVKNLAKVNFGKGELYVSFQSHGAPGWTLGRGGLGNEIRAIETLARFVCELQQSAQKPVAAIILRSCYSAVECEHQGRFFLSSARLVSFLIPGVLVVGFFGSDNGSNKVTGLVDSKVIGDDKGTVSFFKGLPFECSPNPNLFAKVLPQLTRSELSRLCLLATDRLPLVLAQCTQDDVGAYVRHELYLQAVATRAGIVRKINAQRRPPSRQHIRNLLRPFTDNAEDL